MPSHVILLTDPSDGSHIDYRIRNSRVECEETIEKWRELAVPEKWDDVLVQIFIMTPVSEVSLIKGGSHRKTP